MEDEFIGGCLGAIFLTLSGFGLLYLLGAAGDGQSGMILFLTLPLGAYFGSNWSNWRRKL